MLSQATLVKVRVEVGVPSVWSTGAKGCMLHVSGQVTGCISTVAFSFIVQLPVEVSGKERGNAEMI